MVEKSSGKVTPGKVENKTKLISTTSTNSAPEPGSSRMADRESRLAKQGTESHGHDTSVKPGAVPSEHVDMMTHILKELLSATKNSVSEQTPVSVTPRPSSVTTGAIPRNTKKRNVHVDHFLSSGSQSEL